MEAICRRAARIGLPALAFNEQLDVGGWDIERGQVDEPVDAAGDATCS
jgi:hypothetical protein